MLRRAYNARLNRFHDDAAEAVAAHYVLGRRPDRFWANARAVTIPDRLADRLDLYELAGHVALSEEALFAEETTTCCSPGPSSCRAGPSPRSMSPMAARSRGCWRASVRNRAGSHRPWRRMPA
ncbi:tryptophan 7-halogenase [Methylorubrum aminovorans]|uniref:tryptophan 7-halogenase n=1 Tax=Methylorubrum aminovorans TaxID=269069 RepID=UPI0024E1111A|nr:tryptophan 7-halogenase [Methylorubrum aminovorans]